MTAITLNLLHLKNNESLTSPSNLVIQAKLRSAIETQTTCASHTMYLFTQVEDPSYIYLLVGRGSDVKSKVEWIPSAMNKDLMNVSHDNVEIIWTQHVNLNIKGGCAGAGQNDEEIPLNAPVLAIGRYFLLDTNKKAFESTFSETKSYLKAYIAPRTLIGGWSLMAESEKPEGNQDQDRNKGEFVLFSGWDKMEDHFKFAESEEFQEFGKIKEFLEGAEIKHAVRWDDEIVSS